MAMENGYYSAERVFEIGKLAQQALANLKQRKNFVLLGRPQLARKMNLANVRAYQKLS